jgi:hypothetical protein
MENSSLWTALLSLLQILRALPGVGPVLNLLITLHRSAVGRAIEAAVVERVEATLVADGLKDVATEVQAAYDTVKDL